VTTDAKRTCANGRVSVGNADDSIGEIIAAVRHVDIEALKFGRPALVQGVFDAGADGPAEVEPLPLPKQGRFDHDPSLLGFFVFSRFWRGLRFLGSSLRL
jgi:hypothetical protein